MVDLVYLHLYIAICIFPFLHCEPLLSHVLRTTTVAVVNILLLLLLFAQAAAKRKSALQDAFPEQSAAVVLGAMPPDAMSTHDTEQSGERLPQRSLTTKAPATEQGLEQRIAQDGHSYTWDQFLEHYGSASALARWREAPVTSFPRE